MKINFKVRLKNPLFWLTIIPALTTFIYAILGCFNIVPSLSEEVIVNIFTSIITALSTLGVLIDPTTQGVNDSDNAMHYDEPK